MNIKNLFPIIFFVFIFSSCKKEDKKARSGLLPDNNNVVGTWSLQKIEGNLTNNNGQVEYYFQTEVKQPNTQVYEFKADLGYTLTTMLDDGSDQKYTNVGTFKVIESSLVAEQVKHFNFNNYQRINNVITYLDQNHMTIYNFSEARLGGLSKTYEYYVRIK